MLRESTNLFWTGQSSVQKMILYRVARNSMIVYLTTRIAVNFAKRK